jgi:hypothetical protein
MDLNKLARLSHIIAVKFDVVCSASFVESIGRHLEIASFRTSRLKKENAQSQHLDKPFIRSLAKRIVNLSKLVLAVTDVDNGYRAKVTFAQNVVVFVVSESITILRP